MDILATKLCLLLSLAAWAAANSSDMAAFTSFQTKYNRVYSSPQERQERFAVFASNMAKIRSHNSKPNVSWTMGVNQFADMTEDEFKAKMSTGGKRPAKGGKIPKKMTSKPKNFKDRVDWREHPSKPITEPKNQGDCGSCWAHAAIEQIESYHILKYPENRTSFLALSVQELVSCMPNPSHCGGGGGCEGAEPHLAYQWMQSFGITTEEAMPYTSLHGQVGTECNLKDITANKPRVAWTRGYETLPANDYWAHIEHLSNVGPLDIGVAAGSWHLYRGGVMKGEYCNDMVVGHAVQLVGYGTDEVEGDYWLVRNSYGEDFGEDGYIRLQREEEPKCGLDPRPGGWCTDDGILESMEYCGCQGLLADSSYPYIA